MLYPLLWFIVLVSTGVSYLAEKKEVIKSHVTSEKIIIIYTVMVLVKEKKKRKKTKTKPNPKPQDDRKICET